MHSGSVTTVADKMLLSNSGAEVKEAAIKLIRKLATSLGLSVPYVITPRLAFHRRTLAALSAIAQPMFHKGSMIRVDKGSGGSNTCCLQCSNHYFVYYAYWLLLISWKYYAID